MDIKTFKRKIGLNIKSIRTKRDLKQTELADFSLVSKETIGKIERGQQNFTIDTLYAIAEVLKVEPKTLLDLYE